jgi:hypothetical protein
MFNDPEDDYSGPRDKMEIIADLMDELKEAMGPSEDDIHERLGRPKPEMASVKIEAEPMGHEMPMDDDEGAMPDESPEDKLKSRLMKIRG